MSLNPDRSSLNRLDEQLSSLSIKKEDDDQHFNLLYSLRPAKVLFLFQFIIFGADARFHLFKVEIDQESPTRKN
jgi:hypothetical protein